MAGWLCPWIGVLLAVVGLPLGARCGAPCSTEATPKPLAPCSTEATPKPLAPCSAEATPMPISPWHAVVDRIVADTAVLLVGADERPQHVPVGLLPEGVGDGSWVVLDRRGTVLRADRRLTACRRAAAERRLERIRSTPSPGDAAATP